MTPEEKSLLESTYRLVEENNTILQSIRRSNRVSMAIRIGYWAIIILFSLGAYYFIQPYLSMITGGVGVGLDTVKNAQSAVTSLQDLLQ